MVDERALVGFEICAAWTVESVMIAESDLRPAVCRRVRSGKRSGADSCRPGIGLPAAPPSTERDLLPALMPASFSACTDGGDDTGGVGYAQFRGIAGALPT